MPVEWVNAPNGAPVIAGASCHAAGDPPLACLHLWPHRSLPRRGFAAFIGITFAFLLMPLVAVLGTPVLWGLAPFMLGALALIWWMLEKSYRDGEVLEELKLWSDRAELTRLARNAAPKAWQADPYWVTLRLRARGGPVPNYLTLTGAGREVELGAFLSEDERTELYGTLDDLFRRILALPASPSRQLP